MAPLALIALSSWLTATSRTHQVAAPQYMIDACFHGNGTLHEDMPNFGCRGVVYECSESAAPEPAATQPDAAPEPAAARAEAGGAAGQQVGLGGREREPPRPESELLPQQQAANETSQEQPGEEGGNHHQQDR